MTTKSEQDAWMAAHSVRVCPVFSSRMTEQACENYRTGEKAPPQCLACTGISAVGLDPVGSDLDVAMSHAEPQLRDEPAPCADAAAPTEVLSGWPLVSQVTGQKSHANLSMAIRRSQPMVSHVFRMAATGTVPTCQTWWAILDYSGLTTEQIMGRPVKPEELLRRGGWPKGKSRTAPAPESQPDKPLPGEAAPALPGCPEPAPALAPADMPLSVCNPSGLAGYSVEALLAELRRRMPQGTRGSVHVEWGSQA